MTLTLSENELDLLFPANLETNRHGEICRLSKSLKNLCHEDCLGKPFLDFFEVQRPHAVNEFSEIKNCERGLVIGLKGQDQFKLRTLILPKSDRYFFLFSYVPNMQLDNAQFPLKQQDFSPLDSMMNSFQAAAIHKSLLNDAQGVAMRLEKSKQKAEQASKAKSHFLANMSHELRTPLNAILGFSEIIRDQQIPGQGMNKYCEYAGDIHWSANHLLNVINDILDLSKIEAEKVTLEDEDAKVNEVIEKSIAVILPASTKKEITIKQNLSATDNQIVRLDIRKTQQIIINLLSNATKFTDQTGEINITSQLNRNGSLEISIEDSGIGMTEEEVILALKPFRQIESHISKEETGTGLGLPIVDGLMKLHDGEFVLESLKNVGTRATLRFPADRVAQL